LSVHPGLNHFYDLPPLIFGISHGNMSLLQVKKHFIDNFSSHWNIWQLHSLIKSLQILIIMVLILSQVLFDVLNFQVPKKNL
jgi:hypothetical protein